MDPTIEYLWAAGYDLPPAPDPPKPILKPDAKRRGTKAVKRTKAGK